MKTKLTLSIDKDLVEFAHAEAKQSGTPVSALVSSYLARRRREQKNAVPAPTTAQMAGSLKHIHIDDSKQGIRDAYAQKYLR